jgi:DNA-binding NtrC family response regulator
MNDPTIDENHNESSKQIQLLLVDDEEQFVQVLSKRLSKRGVAVSIALNGKDAIQSLRKKDFDVAILDLKMEDMDGIEILKIFKVMFPKMAVIMLTGHGSERAAKEGMLFGAFDYLSKPCDFEELMEKIHQALK